MGARDLAEVLYAQLRPYAHLFCVEGIGAAFTGSVAWYLALLVRFLGHTKQTEAYESQARVAHDRVVLVGDPPSLARPYGSPAGPPDRISPRGVGVDAGGGGDAARGSDLGRHLRRDDPPPARQ